MDPTDTRDMYLKRKKSVEAGYDYSPTEKISRLDEDDEGGGESKSVIKAVKSQSGSKKNFAKNYMLSLGYEEGRGLGKHQNGIVHPVEASKQRGTRGLGFEPIELKDAISKFDPSLEEVSLDEEIEWLTNDHSDTVSREDLKSWVKLGYEKRSIDEDSHFCDSTIIKNILESKEVLSGITVRDVENGRGRSNPFESIHNAIFLNRAAMKMANLDAILDWMFTNPRDSNGESVVGQNELLYFADVCAGPGGFSEYIFYRKKWKAKGFGLTLRQDKDFLLDQFWAGPSETFDPHYGKLEDGNVYRPENITSFREHVLKNTGDQGVHFMMADGGIHIEEKFNDQELICKKLYLCQCLIALFIVRPEGHFVVKLFDLFTEFSVGLIYLMYRCFKEILLIKPNTSRPANSERYLVCKWKREDTEHIGEHLFEINVRVPEFNEKQDLAREDVLELVPLDILLNDTKFYNYIVNSNNRFGNRQVVSLRKLVTYSENTEMHDERQQKLRKSCLLKWNIPDEARAEPKKCDARSKWTELLGNSSLSNLEYDNKKSILQSIATFEKRVVAKFSWNCLVLSGEESNNTCAFYLGLGRNHVHKYTGGKWTKLNDSLLCLPANTLVYGEIVTEYLGSGKGQRKISAFHIIDGLFLGNYKSFGDIRRLPFKERIKMCKLFAKSLYKETCPVRVKTTYPLACIHRLKESLELKSTKSRSQQSLCVLLEADTFYKAGGVMFIRDTQEEWNRHMSNSESGRFYFFNTKTRESFYEVPERSASEGKKVYCDFETSFLTKMIWWWDDGIIHDKEINHSDPSKLQWQSIIDVVKKSK